MRRALLGLALFGMLLAVPARAQLDARVLIQALERPRDSRTGAGRTAAELPAYVHRQGRVSVLVEQDGRWTPFDGQPDEVIALKASVVAWAPSLRPALDAVGSWVRTQDVRHEVGGSGAGAVVGIIDTGFDPTHPDLRDGEGRSRIAYYLDFGRAGGGEPELEARYCEQGGATCAIFSSAQLDDLIGNDFAIRAPVDPIGHGTHVASIAAGNGRGRPGSGYVGVAPEATLIVARAVRPDGSILETDVVRAARFIFEQAEALGMPAVVNVSLGTDFGGHDGTAPLEQALAALVNDGAGRALVVAAGNGGAVHTIEESPYPQPLGIHTEVHVPADTEARVPLLSPSDRDLLRATVFVWVGFRPGDDLAVGLERRFGASIAPVPRGRTATWEDDDVSVTIYNESTLDDVVEVGDDAAALIIDGTWAPSEVFAVRLRGPGTAQLWVQSEGDLGPTRSATGAVFSAASVAGTVNLPGTHPDLITVGATVNRDGWPTRTGPDVEMTGLRLGAVADFSAAGPTATGWLKPDMVAPGRYVVAAMSQQADPSETGGGLFAASSACDYAECLVVDDAHAVSSGTSMAAPVVTGALALLLARRPELTAAELRALLQAGAQPVQADALQAAGAGRLDIAASFAALTGGDAVTGAPIAANSWIVLADDLARPDPDWPLRGLLQLRDERGRPADGFSSADLALTAAPGRFVEPLRREAPGLWSFSIAAPTGSGGKTLEVSARFRGQLLAHRAIPIAVDRSVARGEVAVHGGCAVSAGGSRPDRGALLLLLFSTGAAFRRFRLRARARARL